MKNKKEKSNSLFIIILFAIIIITVLFFPKIHEFIEKQNLPKVQTSEKIDNKEETVVNEEMLENLHYPIMRNSIYDSNTYYSLDKFTINDMSNNDILYNAFMDMYEGNITNSNIKGSCTNISKQFNRDYIELRIKNILGKNINYTLGEFYVPEDADSNYKGTWFYDSINAKFIYNGLCTSKANNTKYYNLEEFIKAQYENNDVVVYYYVGFAKVVDNNYVIYKDANMTSELSSGTFTSVEDLNKLFKSISKEKKKIYKYTFKNTLCSYDEYCLYEGKWVNEL